MFETITSAIMPAIIELVTILIGIVVLYVINKGKKYLDILREKDTIGIIDLITDRVVEYVEVELKGEPGEIKRQYAVTKARQMLFEHGIVVCDDEIIAGIENGVNKLNSIKK